MRCRSNWNIWVAVNCDSTIEVEGLIELPKRGSMPCVYEIRICEAPLRSIRVLTDTNRLVERRVAVILPGACRDCCDEAHLAVYVERHHLPSYVDLGAVWLGIRLKRCRVLKVHQRKALRLAEASTNRRPHHLLESMYRVCGVACKRSALCARIEVKRGKARLVCGYLWACRALRYLARWHRRKIYRCWLGKDRNRCSGRRRNRCRCGR